MNLTDLAFSINQNRVGTSIEVVIPPNGSDTVDFTAFTVTYTNLTETAYIWLAYSKDPEVYIERLDVPIADIYSTAIPKTNVSGIGTWNLSAVLKRTSDDSVIAFDETTFNITLAGSEPVDQCNTGSYIGTNICEALTWLMIPSQSSIDRFSNLWEAIKNKPPMGYAVSTISAFSGLNSSADPVFNIDLPEAVTANIFTPIRTGLNWILWLMFGGWLLYKISHLTL